MLSGDNGILKNATDAKIQTGIGQEKEIVALAYNSALAKKVGNGDSTAVTSGDLNTELTNQGASADGDNPITVTFAESQNTYTIDSNGNIEKKVPPEPMIAGNTIEESKGNKIAESNTELVDNYGNKIIIPKGFKIANSSGDIVKEGIVIEDEEKSQYVWIPVSNINHDGSNKLKVNSADEEGVEITLGRYTFDTNSPGNPTLASGSYQYASSYGTPVTIQQSWQELTTYRQSNGKSNSTATNTTARGIVENGSYNGIKAFVESVRENKGYYVARYEATYKLNGKAGSIQSTSTTEYLALNSAPTTRSEGDLWNFISQGEAATACYDLYPEKINSDLMNSYAWDTAILYIQTMGNTNYSNANRGSNTSLMNTGTTADEKCKINDMAGNLNEWTTEYSNQKNTSRDYAYPCVLRGGSFNDDGSFHTMSRKNRDAKMNYKSFCFRPILYF